MISALALLVGCESASNPPTTHHDISNRSVARPAAGGSAIAPLAAHSDGFLPAGVQFPATVALGDRLLLIGGLDQATASVSGIVSATPGPSRRIGTLPYAVHDAAGAALHGRAYVIGGGEPSHNEILAVESGGGATLAGHLPAAASDVAAGVINGTAYVVGGYTGVAPLDTIVAWTGSGTGRVVAHLPHPVRYAAVAPVGGRLIIAGGTRGDVATREVYSFDPADDQVHQIGLLPRELTHAAGAALGNRVYVIGGRGTDQGTQTSAILAVDPVSGRVEPAGRLPVGLSDLGAATIGGAVVVAGGRQSDGVLSNRLYALRPQVGAR